MKRLVVVACNTFVILHFLSNLWYLEMLEKKNIPAKSIESRGYFSSFQKYANYNAIPSYTTSFGTVPNYPQIYLKNTQLCIRIVIHYTYTSTTAELTFVKLN